MVSSWGFSRDVEGLEPSVLPRGAGCRVGRIAAADLVVVLFPSLSLPLASSSSSSSWPAPVQGRRERRRDLVSRFFQIARETWRLLFAEWPRRPWWRGRACTGAGGRTRGRGLGPSPGYRVGKNETAVKGRGVDQRASAAGAVCAEGARVQGRSDPAYPVHVAARGGDVLRAAAAGRPPGIG